MTIENWRAEIDSIDGELLRLLNRRARLAARVGAVKRSTGLPLCNPEREREVVTRACNDNDGPLDDRAIARIFRRIIYESRRVEARTFEATHTDTQGVLS